MGKNYQDVIAVMEECHPDLIPLDMYLADPSGLDVLKTLRDERYEGPIVMLSGPSMMTVLHDALQLGVDKVVHVPERIDGRFDFGELALAVETTLKSERQHDRKPYRGQIARRAHELYEKGGPQHRLSTIKHQSAYQIAFIARWSGAARKTRTRSFLLPVDVRLIIDLRSCSAILATTAKSIAPREQ